MRVLAKIAYDGSAFSGFAPQKEQGIVSVSNTLYKILSRVGIDSKILAAGRTDKGVHASAQMITFDVTHRWDLAYLRTLLNKKSYPYIFFISLRYVSEDFHPRFWATWRAYRYLVGLQMPNPFSARFVSYEQFGDIHRLQEALRLFMGSHDFVFFKKQGTHSKDSIRTIMQSYAYVYRDFLIVHIRANGFLRAQVRLMLGASFSYARGELSKSQLQAQIDAQSRYHSTPVSPNGLYLCGVGYSSMSVSTMLSSGEKIL